MFERNEMATNDRSRFYFSRLLLFVYIACGTGTSGSTYLQYWICYLLYSLLQKSRELESILEAFIFLTFQPPDAIDFQHSYPVL